MTQAIQQLPLNKLITSDANVRRTGRLNGVTELACSIQAHGLLQNLTVRRVAKGKSKTVLFEVVAGGRRLAALKSLVKAKQLKKDSRIPCHVLDQEIAEEISLAENAHEPMHPADQYEAFALLNREHNLGIEEIAARFGVTPTVVRQRLKLGTVSPKLLALYRAGEMNLDQLTAFTVTDDHARQEQVWQQIGDYADRRHILHTLTEGQIDSSDRRVTLVGIEAYETAGGGIIRDLFDEKGGYLTDVALLDRLVREKLQAVAESVMSEGWKWVEVLIDADHMRIGSLPTIDTKPKPLNDEEQAHLADLQERLEALCEDEDADQDEIDRLESEITTLTEEGFTPDGIARAGAFVVLGYRGEADIWRGYLRPDECVAEAGSETETRTAVPTKTLSSALITELTNQRTASLRNDLAQAPELALIAITHALASDLFYRGQDLSCINLRGGGAALSPEATQSEAGRALTERDNTWADKLPNNGAELWAFIASLPVNDLMALLALCVATSIDAVRNGSNDRRSLAHADVLADALPLNMTRYWQPTVGNYLGRVSKDLILEAVTEGVGEDAARRMAGLKKQAMAQEAERLLSGTGWLPALLRRETTQAA